MKQTLILSLLIISLGSFSQTPITDDNFNQAINTCLSTNPVDGLCYDCEYGAMPDWDVSNVTNMSQAFKNRVGFSGDISNWDVSNVTNMSQMFYSSMNFNQDIGDWDVSNVNNMHGMFWLATIFNKDIGSWNVSNVTIMENMFQADTVFNQDVSNWDVSNVTNMDNMFASAKDFNQNIGNWDVSNVSDITNMFAYTDSFNQDISSWDVSNVTKMFGVFFYAKSFNQDISDWCVEDISSIPTNFSTGSPLLPEYHPHWGEKCIVGVDYEQVDEINIYPNPTESSISVDIGLRNIKEIFIYNQFNQIIFRNNKIESKIDLSSFQPGIYIMEIITEENRIRQKIIKQ